MPGVERSPVRIMLDCIVDPGSTPQTWRVYDFNSGEVISSGHADLEGAWVAAADRLAERLTAIRHLVTSQIV